MSLARSELHEALRGLTSALSLDPIAAGATTPHEAAGTAILRRGMIITALIGLEAFIRDRTAELLVEMSRWPAGYNQLPAKFREAALLNSLSHLQKYATMLKRQQDDYEAEIIDQIDLMALNKGPNFGFSKFIAGDFTGNLSEHAFSSLVSTFQITNCWEAYRSFSSEIGFGIPSVKESLNDLIRKRHRSAHAAGFTPTASDIRELPGKLACLGICFDVSMTSSISYALHDWEDWISNPTKWRDKVDIYFVDPVGSRFRLMKIGAQRAVKNLERVDEARAHVRAPISGRVGVIVFRDNKSKPKTWTTF